MSKRRISLASGVLPEHDAVTVARTAAAAGYSDAGLMVRPETWNAADEPELLEIKAAAGIGYLDVEVLWIPQGAGLGADHQLIADVGARLGADHLLVVSDEADPDLLAPALEQISSWCTPGAVRPMLEFLRITEVQSLRQAREILAAAGEHNFGILIDSLHLARSDEYGMLRQLDASQHSYIQLCDGPAECVATREALLIDALDLRSAPGEGELPLAALLAALPPDLPLSLEVRSKWYRDTYPEPLARATAILEQTEKFLGETNNE